MSSNGSAKARIRTDYQIHKLDHGDTRRRTLGDHSVGRVTLYGIIGWVLRELADLVAFADYEPWWKASASGSPASKRKNPAVSVNKPCTKAFDK